MRKLILFLVLLVSTLSVNANTVQWYAWNESLPEECYKVNGCSAYFFVGDATFLDDIVSSINTGTFNTKDSISSGKMSWGWASGSFLLDKPMGTTVSVFMIVFNSGNYKNATSYIIGNIQTQTVDYGPLNYYFQDNDFTPWQAIPEASVFVMLLAGVCIWALKRPIKR